MFSLLWELMNSSSTRNMFCQTRSLSNATFLFLITWHSSSSKSATMYKISSKSDDFSPRYGDISIFKWRLSAILELFNHHMPLKFHVNLIRRSEDISIWIFRIFGLKCLFRPQNGGFGRLWTPKFDHSSPRPPKGTALRKSAENFKFLGHTYEHRYEMIDTYIL